MRVSGVTLLLIALALHGCSPFGKSEPSRFYVLSAVSEDPGAPPIELTLGLLTLEVPKAVQRSQLVYTASANEVTVAGFDRWAEPVADGVASVMAENLARLVPATGVEMSPWVPGVIIDRRIQIRISHFELDPAAPAARLEALWSVLGSEGSPPLRKGLWSGETPAADSTAASLVAAMSATLGDLAREIAPAVREAVPR